MIDSYPGMTWTVFEITPKMSTYLLAWSIVDFDIVAAKGENFYNWARKDAVNDNLTALADDLSPKMLSFLESKLNFPYPLEKMDLMVIETDP